MSNQNQQQPKKPYAVEQLNLSRKYGGEGYGQQLDEHINAYAVENKARLRQVVAMGEQNYLLIWDLQ